MAYHIDHVHLRSRDAIAAAGFYVDVLRAREIRREGNPVSRVTLDLGGLTLFIEQVSPDTAPGAKPPHLGIEHIGLGVDDIKAAMADLRGRDVTIVSGINEVRPGLRTIFLEGPDGALIELLQRWDVV
jgi:catechol 2,3-dioxygenase-like lactoylglutathione lyase family enzyme